MKRVAVIPNFYKDSDNAVLCRVIEKLIAFGFTVYLDDVYTYDGFDKASFPSLKVYSDFPREAELLLVIGGDGSFLEASQLALKQDIPLIGVNMGKVGYLAEVEVDELDILAGLLTGDFYISEKMLLSVEALCDGKLRCFTAVNDTVVSGLDYHGISNVKIEDSLGNSIIIRGDGVILSTPQGSTAYSLSAGGPILAHDVESILLTPLNPHSFFNRSVLFNSGETITVTNVGRVELKLEADGKYFATVRQDGSVTVKKSEKRLKMITFSKNSMFSTMFKKMRILGEIEK